MAKLNCWDVMGCGREAGGHRSAEQGICPAASEKRLNGVHGGRNGGRACWAVPKTFCSDQAFESIADRYARCEQCILKAAVSLDEGDALLSTMELINRMHGASR